MTNNFSDNSWPILRKTSDEILASCGNTPIHAMSQETINSWIYALAFEGKIKSNQTLSKSQALRMASNKL